MIIISFFQVYREYLPELFRRFDHDQDGLIDRSNINAMIEHVAPKSCDPALVRIRILAATALKLGHQILPCHYMPQRKKRLYYYSELSLRGLCGLRECRALSLYYQG